MPVPLQLFGVAFTPAKVTVLVPCVAPKFAPAIATAVPTTPEPGLRLEMFGAGLVTVKLEPLLACPPTVTTTPPVNAPVGTGATMLVPLQLFGVAFTPPKVTVLVPCVAPKFAPEITTAVPTAPEPGLNFAILGASGITLKLEPLLDCPPTVTTTLPVTAPAGTGTTMLVPLQLFGVAFTPPKVTVLVPCVAPKFAPVITTAVPTAPEPGLTLVMFGDVTVDRAVTAHDRRPIARAAFSNGQSHSPRSLLVEFHLPRGCVLMLGPVKWWLIDLFC
jgi:hypothetical protein